MDEAACSDSSRELVVEHAQMARRSDPQLVLSFARPKRKKGGLEVDDYLALVERLRSDAMRVAKVFKLPGFELDADRADARDRYGLCFSDGRIRVRLVHVRTGHSLKYSALIDTVVHELAHLRYMDHGPRWESLYRRMLEWCRKQGIYEPRPVTIPREERPRPTPAPRAEQLALFAPPRARRSTSRGAAAVSARVAPPSADQLAELAQNVLSAITKG
jgi:hypothetical protein